jgi:glutathione S-transferase
MCLYKPGPPFGIYGTRKDALKEYSKQLYVIADLMDDSGPYLCGDEVSLADATVFPSVIFAAYMFPKFDSGMEQPIPAKIEKWSQTMIETDEAFKKVYDEVRNNRAVSYFLCREGKYR